jgi:Fe-S-cluster-containing hydrogenase component 2
MAEGTRNVMLKVDPELCQACQPCLANEVCRGKAFRRLERDEVPFLDMSRCWGCMDCIPACPFTAVVQHTYEASS